MIVKIEHKIPIVQIEFKVSFSGRKKIHAHASIYSVNKNQTLRKRIYHGIF